MIEPYGRREFIPRRRAHLERGLIVSLMRLAKNRFGSQLGR
jgi:hypothetical protein